MHKFTHKIKFSMVCIAALMGSNMSFAESALVNQAKNFQLGTETIGIDHQKAITLLKQAVVQNDADAMVLLSEYYTATSKYSYLPENPKKDLDLLTTAAKQGNWEAIEILLERENRAKGLMLRSQLDVKKNYQAMIQQGISKKDPRAYVVMTDLLQGLYDTEYSLEQCKLLYQAYQLGDQWNAGARLQACDPYIEEFKLTEENSFSTRYAQQLTQEIAKFKQLKSPTITEKRALLDKMGIWQQDDDILKMQEKLQQQVKDFYIQQAKKGHSDAYIELSTSDLSDSKKPEWLKSAIKVNNSTALVDVALETLYLDEKPNTKLAVQYLEKAVALNNPVAKNVLGVWYVNQNEVDKGIVLFKQAAQMESLAAIENLARTTAEPEAYTWAVQAADQMSEEVDVLAMAVKAYKNGLGVKKDMTQAKKVQQQIDLVHKNANSLQEAFGVDE